MYDLRARVASLLTSDAVILEHCEDRLYQRPALVSPPTKRPFLVYHFGLSDVMGPNRIGGKAQNVHIWVHDDVGDYYRIDLILDRVQKIFGAAPPESTFRELRYIETSPDLEDSGLGTITRFSRYSAVIA